MTLDELLWLAEGAEDIDRRYRYSRMKPEVQAKADKLKETYGTF